MRRGARIAVVVVVVLAALLAINTIVLDSQTKTAEVTAADGKILELSNVALQVLDQPATGSGPEGAPIVLLHCFGCSLQWWDAIAPSLNENHRLIRIDLVGHGGSEKPKSGYEISSQGSAVSEALSELGVRGATVVGHSMGGVVATAVAESASEIVDRVVLIGTASEAGSAELPFRAQLLRTSVIGEALWRIKLGSMIKSAYGSAFAPGFDISAGFDDPDRVVEDSRAMTYTSYTESDAAIDDYLEQGTLASRLSASGVPLLFIDGDQDQILDAEQVAGQFDAVPGAETALIEGVGHSPNVEAPEETAKLILDFAEESYLLAERKSPNRRDGGKPGAKR